MTCVLTFQQPFPFNWLLVITVLIYVIWLVNSPKRSRRDGKPETERIPSSLNTTNGDHVDRDQKHRRRLQDALPLEAPLASDSKEETEAVGKESDKKTSGPRDRTKPSSDILRHRSFFQVQCQFVNIHQFQSLYVISQLIVNLCLYADK